MSSIVNPVTLRTETHSQLLETLKGWNADPGILKALWSQGYGSPGEALRLGIRIRVTLDGRGDTGMSEKEIARHLLVFLRSRVVRRVIAGRGEPKGRRSRLRDLREFKERLEKDYGPSQ